MLLFLIKLQSFLLDPLSPSILILLTLVPVTSPLDHALSHHQPLHSSPCNTGTRLSSDPFPGFDFQVVLLVWLSHHFQEGLLASLEG